MKTKKEYERPTMRVVKLQHTQILVASGSQGVGAQRSGYGEAQEENWN